jgi:hypothetical protein
MNKMLKYFKEIYKLILEREFKKAKQKIEEYTNKIKNDTYFSKYPEVFSDLLRDIGWARDNLDATQEGNLQFEIEAKNIVTALNELVLVIASKIEKSVFGITEKEKLFEDINRLLEPIFIRKNFKRIKLDKNYYKTEYADLMKRLEKELGLNSKFLSWRKNYYAKFEREMGFKK